MKKINNQVHPPISQKKSGTDASGNSYKHIWVKSGTGTILLCKGLTKEGSQALINIITNDVLEVGSKLECTLMITQ
jgi:hypothetical protein